MSTLDDGVKVRVRLSHPVVQEGVPAQVFLRVDVSASPRAGTRPSLDLAAVLDRSGSMAGEKIAYARDAVVRLVDRLLPSDHLALVAFDDTVETVFTRRPVDDALVMRARARAIEVRGMTNLSGGLLAGLQQLGHGGKDLHRVLLLSDGQANVGVTDAAGLADLAAQALTGGRGVSTFGVGLDYDQDTLRAIADAGGGNYYYIASPEDIPGIFEEELGEIGAVVAQNLTVDFAGREAEVIAVLGFQGAALPARAGEVLAGATRSVLLALRVPPQQVGEIVLGEVTCRWTPLDGAFAERDESLEVGALVSADLALVEAKVDEDVLRAAQLQLVADEHLAAVEAAGKGDRAGFARHRDRASSTLTSMGPAALQFAPEQVRLGEELGRRGFAAVQEDRGLQKRAHKEQYDRRKEDPRGREARRATMAHLAHVADRVYLRPWVDAPIPLPPQPHISVETVTRLRGMLLGLAIGDSLGNTSEGQLPQDRRRTRGEIRDYLPNRHAEGRSVGLPTDDTQLAFWTIESLLRRGSLDPDDLARTFASERIYGIGATVRAFLRAYKDQGRPWSEAGRPSAGNGALMRIAPLVFPHVAALTQDLWRDTIAATVLTHRDEMAVAAGMGFVGLLFECLANPAGDTPAGRWWPETFLRYARPVETGEVYASRVPGSLFLGTLCTLVEQQVLPALDQGLPVLAACDRWYSGAYLLETVPSVLYVLGRHGADPEEAIVRAANDTVDNDTIAAIVGAAVGALHGEAALPQRWRDGLLGRTREADDRHVQELIDEAVGRFM